MGRKTVRMFMCAAVAAALGMFGTGAQATQVGVVFDPFTGTALLDFTHPDNYRIDLLHAENINSSPFGGCCWFSGNDPNIGGSNPIVSEGGALIAFDSALIPLSFFGNEPPGNIPCNNPFLKFTKAASTGERGPGHLAQLLCGDLVKDTATYYLTELPTVPEPGTLALILGGVGAAWLTRRRKAAS